MIKLVKQTFFSESEVKEKLIEFIKVAEIFSMGPQCVAYEKKFSAKQGRKHALFVSSGSMANLVLIQSLLNIGRLKPGDRVGVSSLTWATNVMPLIQLGLIPILIDCDLSNLNVTLETLRTEQEREPLQGFFITNVLGFCGDIAKIADYCQDKNIVFFEDNCESLGTRAYGKLLGNFGVASTFSTFVAHHLSTIEGGVVCTDDEQLYEMLLMVRAHGWDRNLSLERKTALRAEHKIDDFFALYSFYDLAYNARPTEIQGVIGCIEIEHWDEIIAKRQDNFKKFFTAATQNDSIILLAVDHIETVSNFAMPVVFKTKELCDEYKLKFKNSGVEIRPVIAGNIGLQPFYKKYFSEPTQCLNTNTVHTNGFYFGNNVHLTDAEVEILCNLLSH